MFNLSVSLGKAQRATDRFAVCSMSFESSVYVLDHNSVGVSEWEVHSDANCLTLTLSILLRKAFCILGYKI